MRRATITIPDELDQAIEAFQRDQEVPPSLPALTNRALEDYLSHRRYVTPKRTFRIRPAAVSSGKSDVSVNHDLYIIDPCSQVSATGVE